MYKDIYDVLLESLFQLLSKYCSYQPITLTYTYTPFPLHLHTIPHTPTHHSPTPTHHFPYTYTPFPLHVHRGPTLNSSVPLDVVKGGAPRVTALVTQLVPASEMVGSVRSKLSALDPPYVAMFV